MSGMVNRWWHLLCHRKLQCLLPACLTLISCSNVHTSQNTQSLLMFPLYEESAASAPSRTPLEPRGWWKCTKHTHRLPYKQEFSTTDLVWSNSSTYKVNTVFFNWKNPVLLENAKTLTHFYLKHSAPTFQCSCVFVIWFSHLVNFGPTYHTPWSQCSNHLKTCA